MPVATQKTRFWQRLPVTVRAVAIGMVMAMVAANVWPLLLVKLGVLPAAGAEALFLAAYVFWAGGGGPPHALSGARRDRFRRGTLSGRQWIWGLAAALCFAATIHAAIVFLFRIVPFPADSFHRGYDLAFIPSRALQWLACLVSALSAAICEETGFRGYMQRPIERRHGPAAAILVSSLFFMLVHLNKDWALVGMTPIVLGAGVLLGTLAESSGTLVFGIIGHTLMDIGLFAYWWSQIAGRFAQRPVSQSGMDAAFAVESAVLIACLAATLACIGRSRRLRGTSSA